MKKILSSLALIALSLTASATPRSAEDALAIARQFVKQNHSFSSLRNARLELSQSIAAHAKSLKGSANTPAYYIVNIEEGNGFVVVSGDDRFHPVLGFSHSGNVNQIDELPEGLQYWLSFLSSEMDAAISAGYQSQAKASANPHTQSVAPLLTTKWDQNAPFNNKIPNYATGCVATGVAQVMNYWKYPQHGVGNHANGFFPQYSADFANTTYDWANMKDEYGGKYDTPAQVNAVSTLMYHLGVATDMRWAKPEEGSGTPNMYAGYALVNFFSYNKNLYAEQRNSLSLGAWKALIIEQLQSGHPLCYAGMTGVQGAAGHFFVLDGYDAETGLFHFNWGWRGSFDGYYNITALEPGTGGIGAGTGSFNYDQQMFVNVQPETAGEYVARFDATEINLPSSSAKSRVMAETYNLQHNSINFKGCVGLAIYNADGTLYRFVPTGNGFPAGFNPGSSISGLYAFDLNLSSVEAGVYNACLAVMTEDDATRVHPIRAKYGSPTYYKMTVTDGTVNFEASKSDYYLSDTSVPSVDNVKEENTLYQNVVSSFTITVKNTGTTSFYDEVGVCIKKSRDSNPQYITAPCSLLPGEEKTVIVKGIIVRDPGNYNLFTCYGENGQYTNLDSSIAVTVRDEASAILNATIDDDNAPIYSISGIRMNNESKLPRGIYIQNGKKLYIK